MMYSLYKYWLHKGGHYEYYLMYHGKKYFQLKKKNEIKY